MRKSTILVFILLIFASFQCEQESINPDCIDPDTKHSGACTLEWNPVCGCDMQTYSNPCHASAAGVLRTTPGECGK